MSNNSVSPKCRDGACPVLVTTPCFAFVSCLVYPRPRNHTLPRLPRPAPRLPRLLPRHRPLPYVSAPTTKSLPSACTTSTDDPYNLLRVALVITSSVVPIVLCPCAIYSTRSTTGSSGLIS